MNITTWLILCVVVVLLGWEVLMLSAHRHDLTISETMGSWGQWWALGIMLGFTVLFWHVWVQK